METDLTNHLWAFLFDINYRVKPHVCPKSLTADLIQELTQRFSSDFQVSGRDDIMLDLPGMMFINRGYQQIKLDTLTIDIPYNDWGVMFAKWKGNEVRTFPSGAKYYKFHTWNTCLVLTPEQRDIMIKTMEEFAPYCEKMADEEVDKILQKHKNENA